MTGPGPSIDLHAIVAHGGAQTTAFEEFCSQLARRIEDVPQGATFQRNGRGADLGVECLWTLPDGSKWGWQAKFVFNVDSLKAQVDESVDSAVKQHKTLTRYIVCFPFDPSAAKGRGNGHSQVEKLNRYKEAWKKKATDAGVKLTIEIWPASELQSRLLSIDSNGGRRLYWFGEPLLTKDWLRKHREEAVALAGPRYTPELNVGHALDNALAALGTTNRWDAQVEAWRQTLTKLTDSWSSAVSSPANSDVDAVPQPTVGDATELLVHLTALAVGVRTQQWKDLRTKTAIARVITDRVVAALHDALASKYGPGAPESKQFRQRQAEYQLRFPAANYDRAQEIASELTRLAEWLISPDISAALAGVLVVRGAAGVGKTHSLCDQARVRENDGLATIVLFGWRFGATPVWDQIRVQLGFSGTWTLDGLLDAMDAAGEATGRPLLLCIDALNETQPRTIWHSELGALVRAIRRRTFVRLCVTCRTGYTQYVIDDGLGLPSFEHQGFTGFEFDACRSFFEHYELKPPIGPLLHPEFSNPLFLKVVCRAIKALGLDTLPVGWNGFREAIKALLAARDAEFERDIGPTARGALSTALEAIADRMAESHARSLSLDDAHSAVAEVPRLATLVQTTLDRLLGDELIILVPGPDRPGTISDRVDHVAFAFERLGDHMVTQSGLRRRNREDGLSSDTVNAARAERGIAEALAVQLPDLWGVELLDAIESPDDELMGAWLRALPWRDAFRFTERTTHWLRRGLGHPELLDEALDAALMLAVRPGHLLDHRWLFRTFSSFALAVRDSVWCPYLHHSWERTGTSTSPVRRLIDEAWGEGTHRVDAATLRAWLSVLTWFLAAADRRVRDEATRALVRLSESSPEAIAEVCSQFLTIDDDYIAERILAATYGAFLRSPQPTALAAILPHLAQHVFGSVTHRNAAVRDFGRCIAELAARANVIPGDLAIERFRPPYRSQWPLTIPPVDEIEKYATDEMRERYPRLWESLDGRFHGDFAIYTVPRAIDAYGNAIDRDSATRWIFAQVLDMGYTPERFAGYDWLMIHRYGGGRGRPSWAERIGKKYQAIALQRLVAHLADNVEREARDHKVEDDYIQEGELPAQSLRDLDPGIVTPRAREHSNDGDLLTDRSPDDAVWAADHDEVNALEGSLWNLEFEREATWYPLEAYVSIVDRRVVKGDRGFRRQIWLQLRSYLVSVDAFDRLWEWARKQQFMGRWMPDGYTLSGHIFLGEYPWAVSMGPNGLAPTRPGETRPFSKKIPAEITPTCHTLSGEFTEDCSNVQRSSLLVPIPQLLDGLRWNGRGGYVTTNGKLHFVDQSFGTNLPAVCLAQREALLTFLERNKLSLLWTALAEKLPGDYVGIPRLQYSHVRGLHEGNIRIARKPVLDDTDTDDS